MAPCLAVTAGHSKETLSIGRVFLLLATFLADVVCLHRLADSDGEMILHLYNPRPNCPK